VLSDKQKPGQVSVSNVFDEIIDVSTKGYLLYGFKPGKWVAGEKVFTMRSDGFASDLGFLVKQGYIEIEKNGEVILLLPSGVEATENISLPKLEGLVTQGLKSLSK